ncbi:hypothetical protein INT45_010841 [Circinella minor]|uniref:TM7S3/TM198-like domain-containing protein n=1 Tax=Circinella minor TaxID=1195481 RepID=A0A8H7SAV8_9FUNG|nr:hypothetical protein INT45_010841 [Circinella minor]
MIKNQSYYDYPIFFLLLICCNATTVYGWSDRKENDNDDHSHQIGHGFDGTGDQYMFDDPYNGTNFVPAHIAVLASFLMAIGAFLMIGGFRFFIITIGMVGFVTGGTITWILLTIGESRAEGYEYPHRTIIYSFACYGAGLIVAGVCIFLWKLSIYGLGRGYTMAMFFWSWESDFVIKTVLERQLISFGFGILGIISLLLIEFLTVCVLTSFLGAYLFMLGLDLVVHAGMVSGPRFMLDPIHDLSYDVSFNVYAMLGGVLGFWLVSTIFQLVFNRGKRFGLNLVVDEANEKGNKE